jgi:hypothetical protein
LERRRVRGVPSSSYRVSLIKSFDSSGHPSSCASGPASVVFPLAGGPEMTTTGPPIAAYRRRCRRIIERAPANPLLAGATRHADRRVATGCATLAG